MTVKDSVLVSKLINYSNTKFGNYYFFKNFLVSEINDDVIFNRETIHELIALIYENYGENSSIHYITNRINSFSVKPTDWQPFFKSDYVHLIKSFSFITYTKAAENNALIEIKFIKNKAKHFSNLNDAINWNKEIDLKKSA